MVDDATLARVATAPTLLVVSDFDGTIAPLTVDAARPTPNPVSVAALYDLAECQDTLVVILSGRDRDSLAYASGLGEPLHLVGSHGAETGDVAGLTPTLEQTRILDEIAHRMETIAARADGSFVEYKPLHRGLHVRAVADDALQEELMTAAADAVADISISPVIVGKCIVEAGVSTATKGTFITALRDAHPGAVVLFAGDDTTDEAGFVALREGDVGIKIGSGDTHATYRLDDCAALGDVYAALARLRRTHVM